MFKQDHASLPVFLPCDLAPAPAPGQSATDAMPRFPADPGPARLPPHAFALAPRPALTITPVNLRFTRESRLPRATRIAV